MLGKVNKLCTLYTDSGIFSELCWALDSGLFLDSTVLGRCFHEDQVHFVRNLKLTITRNLDPTSIFAY